MANNILISRLLSEAVTNGQWEGSGIKGFLVGPSDNLSTVAAVWQNDISDIKNIGEAIDFCLAHFPCGKNVTGIVQVASPSLSTSLQSSNKADIEKDLCDVFGSIETLLELFDLPSVVVLYLSKSNPGEEWITSFVSVTKSSIHFKQVSFASDTNSGTGMRLRLRADIPLLLSYLSNNEWTTHVQEECTRIQNSVEGGMFVFGFDGNRALLHKQGVTLGADGKNWRQVKDIKKYLKDVADERDEPVSGSAGKGVQKPVDVALLRLGSDEINCPTHAPIITHRQGLFSSVQLKLPIDVLVEVKEDLDVQKLYSMMVKSLSRQIAVLFKCLKSHCQSEKFFSPEVFHFKPSSLETAVSIVYPKGINEKELETNRIFYHDRLLMGKDRPCLRKGAAGLFLNSTAPGGYLVNPHIGLSVPNIVRNGKVCVVDGYYSYHHYMQDRFNDDKWGCAYRSLQTIVSWFKYQGYTDRNVPSHREIQQALFEVGDKGEKFVGSRQWIGSFEVSFVLDHLLGVSSKFINVNSGTELSTTGQQLLSHFQTQGTPVMIGGGVLAHTILGVAYDEMTGDIAFLILDPHYTGGEDLKLVQSKGWCGWKDMKFWDQMAHYNMCLPQRPAAV